jgi:hypothetical protein
MQEFLRRRAVSVIDGRFTAQLKGGRAAAKHHANRGTVAKKVGRLTAAKKITPVRRLTVNRKPLRTDGSLAQPPTSGNGVLHYRAFVNLFVSSYLGGAQSTTVPEFVRGAGVPVIQETLVECKTLSQILEEFSLQRVRLCKLDVEGAELAILKTLSAGDLARIQSFALEYHEEAYDLRSLLRLVLDWRTHHVSFIEERPYIGNIMRLAASSALLTS